MYGEASDFGDSEPNLTNLTYRLPSARLVTRHMGSSWAPYLYIGSNVGSRRYIGNGFYVVQTGFISCDVV